MIDLEPATSRIEKLVEENTEASVTYAALECRLAIERICYERLRIAHGYISHDDLKKWQPGEIVKTLIQEVDTNAAETMKVSVGLGTTPDGSPAVTPEDFKAIDYVPLGNQIGFAPNRLGKLWFALAKLALHVEIPTSKDATVNQYGEIQAITSKVTQTLAEIKRISKGTLTSSGMMMGEEVSFECNCGSKNKRRLELLKDGQIVNCIDPECNESYGFVQSDMSFGRRIFEIACRACGASVNRGVKMDQIAA